MAKEKHSLGLIPLKNFGVVSKKYMIYRCAQPMFERDYTWAAEMLSINTIVNLRKESNRDDTYAAKVGMKVYTIPVPDHDPPTTEQADEFVDFVRRTAAYKPVKPILIHCEHGHGRTSTFCVLAKLALGMTLKQALREESKKFHFAFSHFTQERFLEEYYERMRREEIKGRKSLATIRIKKKTGKYSQSADVDAPVNEAAQAALCGAH